MDARRLPPESAAKSCILRNAVSTLFALLVILADTVRSDEPNLKTGKTLQAAMATKVSWSSVAVPLNSQLTDFQQQSGVATLRDRRIDPRHNVTIRTQLLPRAETLQQIAETIPEAASCQTEHYAFVGPADAVYRLPFLIDRHLKQTDQLRTKLKPTAQKKLAAPIAAGWTELSEPRQILTKMATTAGITIANPELIPHDVWSEARLPRMSFAEAATLVLNQFDLSFTLKNDEAIATLAPIDAAETFEHRYLVGTKLKSAVATEWQSRAPSAAVKWAGANAVVTATIEQHILLSSILAEAKQQTTSASTGTQPTAIAGSIRTTNFLLKAERATIGQLIEYFRANKVPIEVQDADADETKAVLNEIVQLSDIKEKKLGTEFFPLIFGQHFRKVEVLDDRVILSVR